MEDEVPDSHALQGIHSLVTHSARLLVIEGHYKRGQTGGHGGGATTRRHYIGRLSTATRVRGSLSTSIQRSLLQVQQKRFNLLTLVFKHDILWETIEKGTNEPKQVDWQMPKTPTRLAHLER